jgi:hypothetical protein
LSTQPRWIKITVSLIALIAILVAGHYAGRRRGAKEYRSFASPDGRFTIVVLRLPTRFTFPGQSLDAPGCFQLREVCTRTVLREKSVEMVQLVDRMEWSPTNVEVGLLANWRLPR